MRFNSDEIALAVEEYNRQHPRDLPKSGSGQCPICHHRKCFGRAPESVCRWFCFSSSHPAGAGRVASNCHWGDLLDLDLLQTRGRTSKEERVQRLKELGLVGEGHGVSRAKCQATNSLSRHRRKVSALILLPPQVALRNAKLLGESFLVAVEDIIESAAIMEFDGGVNRDIALQRALNNYYSI